MSKIRHPTDGAKIFQGTPSFDSPPKGDSAQQDNGKKTQSGGWFLPYLIGFLSGMLVAYVITILIGYIINKTRDDASFYRTAFYGYLIGCQGPGASSTTVNA